MAGKPPHDGPVCGAQKRNKPGICTQYAGWGTDHPGFGKCKLHGGASNGAGEGNKNAVTTGEFEAIWLDQLDPDEQALIPSVNTDKLAQIEQEIVLTEVRERRILGRIASLRQQAMVIAEETEGATDKGSHFSQKRIGNLAPIQSCEEALTRVQAYKARLIELKHRIETDSKGDDKPDGSVDALMEALAKSREKLNEDA